jgi:hypothetical protein
MCPGRDAAFFMPLRRTGTAQSAAFVAAPVLRSSAEEALHRARGTLTYFPFHAGLRFSPNAARPSLASSVIAVSAIWLSV